MSASASEQYRPLLEGVESGLKGLLNGILDEGIADLDGPIREISTRLALAARRKRGDLVSACKDQLALIVLERELQVKQDVGQLWQHLLFVGVDALISGAIGGLNSRRA